MALSTFLKSVGSYGRRILQANHHNHKLAAAEEAAGGNIKEERFWMQFVNLVRRRYSRKPQATTLMLAFYPKKKYMDEVTPPLFDSWCQKYGKVYSSEKEKLYRFKVFKTNYAKIIRYNKIKKPYHCTNVLNEAADLTNREFFAIARHKGCIPFKEVFRHWIITLP